MHEYATLALILAVPILTAIIFHEVGHGWAANRLGDPTAALAGRLTLNPIAHIDPIGTIVVPAVLYFSTGFLFGWARPVPVNFNQLKSPRRDMALVAAAGPFVNLLFLFVWAFVVFLARQYDWVLLLKMAVFGIQINIILIVLNLLPIPPLDGSRIVASFLPPAVAQQYNRLATFGFVAIIVLVISGVFGQLLDPILRAGTAFFFYLF